MALKQNAARNGRQDRPSPPASSFTSSLRDRYFGQMVTGSHDPLVAPPGPDQGISANCQSISCEANSQDGSRLGRTFPNAITLATNLKDFKRSGNEIIFPKKSKFLVVDGQHRLWAQTFSKIDGQYACIIHLRKTEKEMAELFLEINENQRRVPSSLRWDLVRLVRPTGDEAAVTAAELVFELATRQESPFYFSIDLTGEKKDVSIKQGSLAPEIKTLVGRVKKVHNPTFEEYTALLFRFFSAVRSLNPDGWGDPTSTYYQGSGTPRPCPHSD